MAKTNKADMSCARVKKYTASDVSKAERHNERKNETYENMNVIVERIPFNVHFKKPTAPTYMEQLKQMETDGQVSLRGLRKDATLFDEIVIDVNTMYFERNGGYEYAKGETSRDIPLGDDAHGNIVRIDNGIERFEETLADTKNSLENTEKQFETAKQEIEKPFAKEEELRAKTARLDELNILLNMDKKENEIVGGEPDEGEAVGGRKEKSYER